jgi:hypothetical protein
LKPHIYIVLLALCWVFLGTQAHAQHPIGYGSLKSTSQEGTFSFAELDRAIVIEKTARFFSAQPVSVTFDVLVAANGDVKYVRSPRLAPDQSELRLACTSALYDFSFAPVDATVGEKWFKATLVVNEP